MEGGEVLVFGRVVRAVHAGIEKDVEMGGEGKVGKSEDVVSVCGGVVRTKKECLQMCACAGEICVVGGQCGVGCRVCCRVLELKVSCARYRGW